MNVTLGQDIEKELISGSESQRIQEAVLQQEEGTIDIFVRYGRHQMTTPPPVNLLSEDLEGGLRFSAYKDMVQTIKETVRKIDKEINFGHLIVRYTATEDGFLKKLNIFFKDVVLHNGNKKKTISC